MQLDWMGWMFKGEGNRFGSFCWVSGWHMCMFDVCECRSLNMPKGVPEEVGMEGSVDL